MPSPADAAVAMARLHLLDALEGRLENGRATMKHKPLHERLCFALHSSPAFSLAVNAACLGHVVLTWLEQDAAWRGSRRLCALEGACIATYLADVGLKWMYMGSGKKGYLSKSHQRHLVALVALLCASWAEGCVSAAPLVRHAATPLRPAVLLLRSRQVRRLFGGALACLGTLARLARIVGPLLLFFGALAVALFAGTSAHGLLGSPGGALRSLAVLLTTDNLEEVSGAARAVSPVRAERSSTCMAGSSRSTAPGRPGAAPPRQVHSCFVVAFVVLGSFVLMNILPALVFAAYCEHHARVQAKEEAKQIKGASTHPTSLHRMRARVRPMRERSPHPLPRSRAAPRVRRAGRPPSRRPAAPPARR